MKRIILLLTAVATLGTAHAQITKTISTGAGYANENYYELSSENEASVVRDNWDLAFASDALGFSSSAIRINGTTGTELYKFNNDIADWANVDTTGFDWASNQLINSDTAWTVGAFDNTTLADDYDLGWGSYSFITHAVVGDRTFIIKLADATYRKLVIEKLLGGIYEFKYADLDGTNEVSTNISKTDFSGKNFAYYSIQNNVEVDREPAASTWDLVFTKYQRNSDGYPVTGVLANTGVNVVQLDNVNDVDNVPFPSQAFGADISTIGYDWKSFNMNTFQYELEEARVYFVENANQDIYKLVFTGFGGSRSGDYTFTQELVTLTGLDDNATLGNLEMYPNPSRGNVNIVYSNQDALPVDIELYDLTGQKVYSETISNSASGLNQYQLDNLNQGIYVVVLRTGDNQTIQKKLVIN